MSNIDKGVSKFIADIRKGLNSKIKDAISEVAAKTGAQLIQRRTRDGRGVATDGGSTYTLKRLSSKYIDFRKTQTLSPHTSAAKSNLTFTGEMLGSLDARRESPGRWLIILKGSRNENLAKYAAKTRPFMHLSGGEIETIKSAARKKFEQLVKKNF